MMISRILKKDWGLLWPLALLTAFTHALAATLWVLRDHGRLPAALSNAAYLFPLLEMLASAVLCVAVIHTDPIPGNQEDWLARPIRRTDLMAAKLLFVLTTAAGPAFAAGAAGALLDGFSWGSSLAAGFWRSAAFFVEICLPAMALGVVTRNAMEAFVGAAIAGVLAGIYVVTVDVLIGVRPTLMGSGLNWLSNFDLSVVILVGALVILLSQYLRRATRSSRLLAIVFLLLALPFQVLPWNGAFATQEALDSGNDSSNQVTIGFDPGLGRSPRTAISAGVLGAFRLIDLINLPIRADGVATGDVLYADQAEVRLIADGKVIYRQASALGIWVASAGNVYTVRAPAHAATQLRQDGASGAPLHGYQAILLPVSLLRKMSGRDLALEIDYSLSLLRRHATMSLPALDASQHLGGIGWCNTGIDDDGDEVQIGCIAQPGQMPGCLSATLDNPESSARDTTAFICQPNYAPIPINLYPDALARFRVELPFKGMGNAAKSPVNEAQLSKARVDLATYLPAGVHFTRRMVIPHIRLGDWEAPPDS
jgi:hypothetical protein